jgi:cell wall-associated NlpC family hydrolase
MKICLAVAYSLLNVPYIYGGKSPAHGIDCNKVAQIIMHAGGADLPGDQNSQALFDHFSANHLSTDPQIGALCFYGKGPKKIYHVAWMIDRRRHIEAAGGDSTTLTLEIARQRGAFVKITPARFTHPDFMGCFLPEYPLVES